MDIEKSINSTRQGFEQSFQEEDFYNKQTSDGNHLKLLLDLVNPKESDTILDLGTGSGYIAFPLSELNQKINVIGMDIVIDTLERNTNKAVEQGRENLEFTAYDGKIFPFRDGSLDTVITRYALHHFPNIEDSFREMFRVLRKGGKLVISDPTPNINDTVGFIDKFMQMKKDGHIKFYSFSEFKEMLEKSGFRFLFRQDTFIRFPRKNPTQYNKLFLEYDERITSGYEVEVKEDEIWIKESVLNMVFQKV